MSLLDLRDEALYYWSILGMGNVHPVVDDVVRVEFLKERYH